MSRSKTMTSEQVSHNEGLALRRCLERKKISDLWTIASFALLLLRPCHTAGRVNSCEICFFLAVLAISILCEISKAARLYKDL